MRLDCLGEAGRAMLGFAPLQGFDVNGANYFHHGWFIFLHNGSLYSEAGDKATPLLSSFAVGSVLTVVHSAVDKQISFEVDGGASVVAFKNVVVSKTIFPAIYIHDMNFQCTLML